jgi:hypothetical protein
MAYDGSLYSVDPRWAEWFITIPKTAIVIGGTALIPIASGGGELSGC